MSKAIPQKSSRDVVEAETLCGGWSVRQIDRQI